MRNEIYPIRTGKLKFISQNDERGEPKPKHRMHYQLGASIIKRNSHSDQVSEQRREQYPHSLPLPAGQEHHRDAPLLHGLTLTKPKKKKKIPASSVQHFHLVNSKNRGSKRAVPHRPTCAPSALAAQTAEPHFLACRRGATAQLPPGPRQERPTQKKQTEGITSARQATRIPKPELRELSAMAPVRYRSAGRSMRDGEAAPTGGGPEAILTGPEAAEREIGRRRQRRRRMRRRGGGGRRVEAEAEAEIHFGEWQVDCEWERRRGWWRRAARNGGDKRS